MKRKSLMLVMLCICSFLASANAHGKALTSIKYIGQETEVVDLSKVIKVTRYRSENYQSTCTRQVPYLERVCHDETRYREECHYVDGHQECRTEYENECHYVTRYRRECRLTPGREVCRTETGRRICRNHNGRQVCRNAPGRRVCHHTAGRRVCQNNPYQEYICETIPRHRCDYIPGHNVCSQFPYSERVCGDVTRYRDEEYACTQTRNVPYVVNKKVQFRGDIVFINNVETVKAATLKILLNDKGDVVVNFLTEDVYYVTIQKDLHEDDRDDELIIDGTIVVNMALKDDVLSLVRHPIKLNQFSKKIVQFTIGNNHSLVTPLFNLKIVRQRRVLADLILIDRVLRNNEYEIIKKGEYSVLVINLKKLGIVIKDKKHELDLGISIDLARELNTQETHFNKYAEFISFPR